MCPSGPVLTEQDSPFLLPQSLLLREMARLYDFLCAPDWHTARDVLTHFPEIRIGECHLRDLIEAPAAHGQPKMASLLRQAQQYLQGLPSDAEAADPAAPPWWLEWQKEVLEHKCFEFLLLSRPLIQPGSEYFSVTRENVGALIAGWLAVVQSTSFIDAPLGWRLDALNAAGNSLLIRASQGSPGIDLEAAEELYQKAIDESPAGWPNRGKYLHNLGRIASYRYRYTGADADLNGALEFEQRALQVDPASTLFLGQLSQLLVDRFERTGTLADLDQAISVMQQTRSRLSAASLELPVLLNQLGSALRNRFVVKHETGDIEGAVKYGRESVKLTTHVESLPVRLNNLGNSLLERASTFGSAASVTEAIETFRRAVQLSPPGSILYPARLNNLGNGLRARYAITGDLSDLEEGIRTHEEALRLTSETDPQLPSRLYNKANALRERWHAVRDPQDVVSAVASYQRACVLGTERDPRWAFFAARNWAAWASDRRAWREASNAYSYGFIALERLVGSQLSRSSKETWLSQLQTFSAHAAFAFYRAGRLARSVLALEQGRAYLLTEALQLHSVTAEDLRARGHRELASAYQQAVENWAIVTRLSDGEGRLETGNIEQIRAARMELDSVLSAIRKLPGLESFARPARMQDVRDAARLAPLVYLAAAEHAGLALIVKATRQRAIRAIPLDLDESTLRQKTENFQRCYLNSKQDPQVWLTALDDITDWLWHTCIGPVFKHLKRVPRAALIPCGLLSLLPLQAAWRSTARGQRRYALEGMTLTYVPNARSLVAAAARTAQGPDKSLLIVADPAPTRLSRLPYATAEGRAARSGFEQHLQLKQKQATREKVIAALSEYETVHMACHAFADVNNPLQSGFVLAEDQLLTVEDLLHARLDLLRLAVLSACETNVPGEQLPDEIVSLSSAFFQAGTDAVIASQWEVLDASTLILMARFYHLWRKKKLPPAEALRQSQLWMRATPDRVKSRQLRNLLPKAILRQLAESPHGISSHEHPDHWAAFAYVGI
jgi:CHAT domain-containing protein/tetratricopeptide (TPR) repeat protein